MPKDVTWRERIDMDNLPVAGGGKLTRVFHMDATGCHNILQLTSP